MDLRILDEVAYFFVDQFDNLYGMLVDRTDVRQIRKAADDGLDAIYAVVSSVFGDKLEDVLYGAAYTAMDSIAYEDESWTPKDVDDIHDLICHGKCTQKRRWWADDGYAAASGTEGP